MTQPTEQLQNRRAHLLREAERRMLVQLHGLMRSTADEINAELEKEELCGEPVTVEQLREVIQSHLFERVHKGDLQLARSLLEHYQQSLDSAPVQDEEAAPLPRDVQGS